MGEKHVTRSAAYVILEHNGKVLLSRRANTGWQDGMYGLPSGHIEKGESPTAAAVREAFEETGVTIDLEALRPVHVMHRKAKSEDDREYYDFFFTANEWQGEPSIMEADKCDELSWFSYEALPDNLLDYLQYVFEAVKRGDFYSER